MFPELYRMMAELREAVSQLPKPKPVEPSPFMQKVISITSKTDNLKEAFQQVSEAWSRVVTKNDNL